MNIITILKADHKMVKDLLEQMTKTTARSEKKRATLFEKLVNSLTVHEEFEEQQLYPKLANNKQFKDKVLESYEEHHVVDLIVAELKKTSPTSEIWKAKVTVLKENLEHHISEEHTKLFPHASKILTKETLNALGEEYLAFKEKAGVE